MKSFGDGHQRQQQEQYFVSERKSHYGNANSFVVDDNRKLTHVRRRDREHNRREYNDKKYYDRKYCKLQSKL